MRGARHSQMASSKFLSFAEIVQGRDANVRVTEDGLVDLVDLVMTFTGKNCNDSNEVLRDLKPSLFDKDRVLTRERRRYVTRQDAIALVMVLPGKMAAETRVKFAAIIERHIDIQVDPATGKPTVKLQDEPVEDPEARRKRVRREELEMARMEEEVHAMRTSNQREKIQNAQSFLSLMTTIRPDWMQTDARFRLQTEDMIKNIMAPPSTSLQITQGEPAPQQPASLSISQLAQELGCKALTHPEACSAGKLAAKRYRAKHDADPPKHRQWVDGAERTVNSYTEDDRDLLTGVLTDLGLTPEG